MRCWTRSFGGGSAPLPQTLHSFGIPDAAVNIPELCFDLKYGER